MDALARVRGHFGVEFQEKGFKNIVILLLVVSIDYVLWEVEVLAMLDGEASRVFLGVFFGVSFGRIGMAFWPFFLLVFMVD